MKMAADTMFSIFGSTGLPAFNHGDIGLLNDAAEEAQKAPKRAAIESGNDCPESDFPTGLTLSRHTFIVPGLIRQAPLPAGGPDTQED